jgi:hypothetical protein
MGLRGNLSTVNLADVFQVLSRGNSTGLLRIQAPEGPRFVEIQNGAISIAGRSAERIMLGDLLLSRGLIDEANLDAALAAQKESGKLLGQVLIEMGIVAMEHLEEALRFQIEEEVCELFILRSGDFDFLANASLDAKIAPGGGMVRLKIDPNALLIEAARRADEWQAVEARITSQAMLFKLTDTGNQVLQSGEGISSEGAILLKLVLAQRTPESMVQKSCLGRLTTNQMLIELWDAGMLEPLPMNAYEKIAREHLRLTRYEEAQRIAAFMTESDQADIEEVGQQLVREIDKAKKIALQGSSVKVSTDPKVRSEVIRRSQPNLMLKKERSIMPVVIVALLILLAGGGAAYFFLGKAEKGEDPAARKDLEAANVLAMDLISKEKYDEGLKAISDFATHDSEVKKLQAEYFKKRQTDVESALKQALDKFDAAMASGQPEQLAAAEQLLRKFSGVGVANEQTEEARRAALEKLDQRINQKRSVQFQTRIKAVRETEKNGEKQIEAYRKILSEKPPEDVAQIARDELSKLDKARRNAARALKQAQSMRAGGDLEGARREFDRARQAFPDSALSKNADEAISELATQQAKAEAEYANLERLARNQEVKADLEKFLKNGPPHNLAMRALASLGKPDPAIDAKFKEAGTLWERQPDEARKQTLALLSAHPHSKAAFAAAMQVKFTSEPPGAELTVNGTVVGSTPLTASVPACGPVSLIFKKDGFQPLMTTLFNFRQAEFSARLQRDALIDRRLPFAAGAGMAVADDYVLLYNGRELCIATRGDLKVLKQIDLGAGDIKAASPWRPGVTAAEGHLLLSNSEPLLFSVFFPAGETRRITMKQPATSGAFEYSPLDKPETIMLGAATRLGFESFSEEGSPTKQVTLTTQAAEIPYGAAFETDTVFIPRNEALFAVHAVSGATKWQSEPLAQPISAPVYLSASNCIASVDAAGKLIFFEKDSGKQRLSRELKGNPAGGCVATSAGVLVQLKDGRTEMSSSKGAKLVWTANLRGEPTAPPLPLRATARDTEKGIAFCTAADDEFTLTVLSAGQGELIWQAQLGSKPVAMATDGRRLFVSTDDGDVHVFELN